MRFCVAIFSDVVVRLAPVGGALRTPEGIKGMAATEVLLELPRPAAVGLGLASPPFRRRRASTTRTAARTDPQAPGQGIATKSSRSGKLAEPGDGLASGACKARSKDGERGTFSGAWQISSVMRAR